jgi:S-adenosylmethionine hydrolase
MPRPIALLTDFGYQDVYAGVMRAVLTKRCPGAPIIDLTHGIPAANVLAGALELAGAAPYCPDDTVFVGVVDPGVGGERRALCIRAGGRYFVGPDNGLLWLAAAEAGEPEAFHLDRPEHWLPQPSATFHGRDIFAPVAAGLACGIPPEQLGTAVANPQRLVLARPAVAENSVAGEVLLVDGYGNCVTNLRPENLGCPAPCAWRVQAGDYYFPGPSTHYGAVAAGKPLFLVGSMGYYEVALNQGRAAERLNLRTGSRIRVSRQLGQKPG